MARGKQTCKILKEIRRRIAEANGIEFVTSECRYKGDCTGTCPKCEAEVRYLEQQLRTRSLAGKAVALAGISAGVIALSGCGSTSTKNQSNDDFREEIIDSTEITDSTEVVECIIEEGEIEMLEEDTIACPDSEIIEIIQGEVFHDNAFLLEGEVAYVQEKDPEEDRIYTTVERMPEFQGGEAALIRFIRENLKYPEDANGCAQGKVVIQFYVDTLGHVCAPRIYRGIGRAFDIEALRVVRLLPDFIPGEHNGKKVNVWYTLPISFKHPDIEPKI